MELTIKTNNKKESERLISFLQLGLLYAIEKKVMTIDEAESFLFNPYTAERLKGLDINEVIIGIIEEGCHLEDYESLLPDELSSKVIELKERILNEIMLQQQPIITENKIIK